MRLEDFEKVVLSNDLYVTDEEIDNNLETDAEKDSFRTWHYLQKTRTSNYLDEFDQEIETARQGMKKVWKTGIAPLDEALDGGFLGGNLISLGATSGLGKTTLALQIAAKMAQTGNDVLIFSLEMSKAELTAKIISRYMYEEYLEASSRKQIWSTSDKVVCTARDIIVGNIDHAEGGKYDADRDKLYKAARADIGAFSDHLYMFIGNFDVSTKMIENVIKRHIKARGTKPFVIVDYLQILEISEDSTSTEKRLITDDDVKKLKTVARDNDLPIMVISAFNRASYLEPVSKSSFRESSGIEYSSDVMLGLQYVGCDYVKHWKKDDDSGKSILVYENETAHKTRVRMLADAMDKRNNEGLPLPVDMKIMKQRLSPSRRVCLNFLPAYNHYYPGDYDTALQEALKIAGYASSAPSGKKGAKPPKDKDGKALKPTSGI